MSENKDEFLQKAAERGELEAKKREVLGKELKVKERRLDNELDRLDKLDEENEKAKQNSYGRLTDAEIAALRQENRDYLLAARKKMPFLTEDLSKAVPFFRKNLIFIGGKTGEGKSTIVANLIRTTIANINKETGKASSVLVITNEEKREDVFNRVTCQAKGWHYVNHDKFTDEQLEAFDKYTQFYTERNLIRVIDDNDGGTRGNTTTIEGLRRIFDRLIADGQFYDVILIDYYQNFKESLENPYMNEWQVQAEVAAALDQYKNIYPAPIVVLGQVKPPTENNTPFKERIEGRKVILNVATCALEIVRHNSELRTEWVVHKSRFGEMLGESLNTGYDKGRFVQYTDEFITKVNQLRAQRENEKFNKSIGHVPIIEEKKDGTGPEQQSTGQPGQQP